MYNAIKHKTWKCNLALCGLLKIKSQNIIFLKTYFIKIIKKVFDKINMWKRDKIHLDSSVRGLTNISYFAKKERIYDAPILNTFYLTR